MGAIQENNIHLVRHFLSQIDCTLMHSLLTHETKFGDSLVTYAAALGRTTIVEVLIKAITSLDQITNRILAVSDLLDHETSRGKTPIIEAAKCNHADVVELLLRHQADPKLASKVHRKSAMDWALVLGHDEIARIIHGHIQLKESSLSLFMAVSKSDVPTIKSLTEGGVPYFRNQDEVFKHEIDSTLHQVDLASQNLNELAKALQECDADIIKVDTEMKERAGRMDSMQIIQREIVASRRDAVMAAVADVRLAMTSENITNVCRIVSPPLEYEMVSKALCTLLRIKMNDCTDVVQKFGRPQMPHWEEVKVQLLADGRLYHRIHYYQFETKVVETAMNVQVDGLPGTYSDQIALMNTPNSHLHAGRSSLMSAFANWLTTIFQSLPGYKLEHELIMQESTERELLERNKVNSGVLASRSAILKREMDDVSALNQSNTNRVSQLRRQLEISKLMKTVNGGYSILSWAAAVGNAELVELLLKRGAHTVVGKDCMEWCATIVQVAYRHFQLRKKRHELKWNLDFIVSMRIRSLNNLLRERLKSLRLPLAEALFNGHSKVARMLDRSDVPNSQALNMFHLFCKPQGTIPKSCANYDHSVLLLPSGGIGELISTVMIAAQRYSHEDDPCHCANNESLNTLVEMATNFLRQRKKTLEAKIDTRRETLRKKHRNIMSSQLSSTILRGDFVAMVNASTEGNISLDYEDGHTGMTPLIRAAMEKHTTTWCTNTNGERVSAVAYLIDRISPHRPSVDYENRFGYTALGMACMHGNLDAMVDLIHRGANVDRKSLLDGRTPWMLAKSTGKVDAMKLLSQYSVAGEEEGFPL